MALATLLLTPPIGAADDDGARVSLPEPTAGDRGVYHAGNQTVEGDPVGEPQVIRFELGSPELRADAYAREQQVWPFIFDQGEANASERTPRTSWLVDATSPPIEQRGRWTKSEDRQDTGPLGSGEAHFRIWTRSHVYSHQGQQLSGPSCLLTGAWQGEVLREGDRLEPVFCGRNLSAVPNLTATLNVARVHETGDAPSALVVLDAATAHVDLTVRMWFREDIAYPMSLSYNVNFGPEAASGNTSPAFGPLRDAVAWPLAQLSALPGPLEPEGDPSLAVSAELTLDRFGQGEGEALPGEDRLTWPQDPALVETGPVDAWGPEDGGETFPFPLSQAIRSIERDPTLGDFHAWAEDHPDRRLTAASYLVTESRTVQKRAYWFFEIRAPDGTYWSVSSWKELGPDQVAGLRDEMPAIRNDAQPDEADIPMPDPALERGPTIASVLQVWRQTFPTVAQEHQPNTFTWLRGSNHSFIQAGWEDPRTDASTNPLNHRIPFNRSTVEVALDGALVQRSIQRGNFTYGTVAAGTAEETSWTPPPPPPGPGTTGMASLASITPQAAAAAGVLAVLLALAAKLGFLPFYSRLSDDELLENDTRRALHNALAEHPAARPSELAAAIDADRSTVRYHLRKLEEGALARKIQAPDGSRWFRAGYATPERMRRQALLASGQTSVVYEAIRRSPGASLVEVAQRAGLKPPSAHRIVERLLDAGLVDRQREGRTVSLHPNERA